jgi:tetratricopeptide (TPR) repeat protein
MIAPLSMKKVTKKLFIIWLGLYATLSQAQSPTVSSWEAKADTLYKSEKFGEAEIWYSKILSEARKKGEEIPYSVLYKRGVCYFSTEQFDKAEADLNTFVKANPSSFQGRILRGLIYQALENPDGQLIDVNAAIQLQGNNPNLLRWRGGLYLQKEEYDSAKQDLLIVRQFGDDPEVEMNLGMAYFNANKPDSAFLSINRSIELNATNLPVYLYGATFSLQEERYEQALQYLKLGQRIDPVNPSILFYKGISLIELKREKEGCSCLGKAFMAGIDEAGDYLQQHCWNLEE